MGLIINFKNKKKISNFYSNPFPKTLILGILVWIFCKSLANFELDNLKYKQIFLVFWQWNRVKI
jgi:hypothetical protein